MHINSTQTKPEQVILIHGTAAGDPSDEGKRWWQTGSNFSNELQRTLGADYRIERPFHWSGANWESERSAAGRALLKRLRELEQAETPYHLVGHSHGGSVILHALRLSCTPGQARLKGLRSWTTVGTPFLRHAAEPFNTPLLLATAAVTAALAAVLFEFWLYLKDDPWHWIRDPAWILPAALILGLTAVAISLFFLSIRPLIQRARVRLEALMTTRAEHCYARHWLGLWHSSDEPINGLASSLGAPQMIVARMPTGRGLLAALKLPLAIYNIWLATAGDQFIWRRLARKVQGNDLPGRNLTHVGRSPFVRHQWLALPEHIAQALTERSDAQAAKTLSSARRLLGAAYLSQDGQGVVAELRTQITWGELIHNSYFDIPELAALIGSHIRRRGDVASSASAKTADPLQQWLAASRDKSGVTTPAVVRRPFHELNTAIAVVMVGVGALLSLSTVAMFRSLVAPYTDRAQIDQIETAIETRELLNIHGSEAAGSVLQGLYANGRITDVSTFMGRIREPNAFLMAGLAIGSQLGAQNDVGQLTTLRALMRSRNLGNSDFEVLASFLQGLSSAGRLTKDNPLLREAEMSIASAPAVGQSESYAKIAIMRARMKDLDGARAAAAKIVVERRDNLRCYSPEFLAGAFAAVADFDKIVRSFDICGLKPDERGSAWLKLAQTAAAEGFTDAARHAAQQAASAPDPIEKFNVIRVLLSVGEVKAAEDAARKLRDGTALRNIRATELAIALNDAGLHDVAKEILDTAVDWAIAKAKAMQWVTSISLQELSPTIAPLMRFGQTDRAKAIATAMDKIASAKKTTDEDFVSAQLLATEGLRSAGLKDGYQAALARVHTGIEAAPERRRYDLWIGLAKLVGPDDRAATVKVLRHAEQSAGVADEYQTRAKRYAFLARAWAAVGFRMEARRTAERANVPEELLKGYSAVLGFPTFEHERPPLGWFRESEMTRVRELVTQAQGSAIDQLGLDSDDSPLEADARIAAQVCKLTLSGKFNGLIELKK